MDRQDPVYEAVQLRGAELASRVSNLLRQTAVRRLIIRDDHENTLLEIPVTPATATTRAPSVLAAVSAIGAVLPAVHVVIVKTESGVRAASAAAPTSRLGATEDQMNTRQMVAQRIDNRGTRIEDLAGTGEHDAPGG